MDKHPDKGTPGVLPPGAVEYIGRVVAAIRCRRRVRQDITAELMAHRRVCQQVWRMKTDELATLTIVAVLRYAGEHNGYPETLDQLVQASYLDSLPADPFGAGPLSYRRTADGFLLYSWGENLTDDGGVQGLGPDGAPRLWSDDGDWVFWPYPE